MAKCKEESGGGSVAGESIYGWFEGSDQVVESIYGIREEAGGLGPCEVEAIGEEFSVGGGDECGVVDNLGLDLGESEDESFDDS